METEYAKWEQAAREIDPARVKGSFRQPISVILQEALSIAAFCIRRWKAERRTDGTILRAGLEIALFPGKVLKEDTAVDIESLIAAVNHAQLVYEIHLDETASPAAQGHRFLREMRDLVGWIADGDARMERMVENLARAHASEPRSNAALALALEAYASLCEEVLPRLEKAPAFDHILIARARAVAMKLRGRGSRNAVLSDPAYYALDRRNRLLVLLIERVHGVRVAARFAFRDDPERLREAASPYNRSRRTAAEERRRSSSPAAEDTAPPSSSEASDSSAAS